MINDPRMDPLGIRPDGDEGDVAQIVGGVVAFAPAAAPTTGLDQAVVSVTNGVPYVMFDADGTPVTEG